MSQVQLDKRITMSNVINIAVLVVTVLYYMFGVQDQVDDNTNDISALKKDVIKIKVDVSAHEKAYSELVRDQRSILKLNKLIANKLGIVYVIDVDE